MPGGFKILKTLLSGGLLFLSFPIVAQFYPVDRFTVEDGLPHSNVFRIMQDRKGFMWFGTEYGLSCFDGKRFVNYTSSAGLSFNTVMSVSETDDGRKWVCTYGGGINVIVRDSIRRLNPHGDMPDCVIYSLIHEGNIWIIDKNGNLFRISSDTIRMVAAGSPGEKIFFRRMIRCHDGRLIFTSDRGLFTCDRKLKLQPWLREIISEKVYAIENDRSGYTWLSLGSSIIKLRGDKISEVFKIPNSSEVSDLLADRQGNVWIAIPQSGIFLLKNGRFEDISARLQLQNILVNDLFEDRNGNVWIATHGSGLHCVRSLNISNYPVQRPAVNNYSKAIESRDGKVILSSIGKLAEYRNGVLVPLHCKALSSVDFIYFVKLRSNKLYVGTPVKMIIKDLSDGSERVLGVNAISMHEDRRGNTWVGHFSGLSVMKGDSLIPYRHDPAIQRRRINDICSDSSGRVYFATDSGVFIHDGKKRTHFSPGSHAPLNQVNAVFEKGGALWLATDWGLCCLEKGKLKHYGLKEGLSHIKCTSLSSDEAGNLWVGTLGGLNYFSRDKFTHYNNKSGLISNEVISLTMDADKVLWVGTVNGISRILPEGRQSASTIPQVYITGADYTGKNYFFPTEVTLGSGISNLHIDFSGIDLPRGDKVEFEYRIINQNESWVRTTHNSADVSLLNPGRYQFVLRARSNGQDWSKTAVMDIIVPEAFWESAWFRILCLILGAAAFYLLIKWWIMRKEKLKREKMGIESKILTLKQQALSAQINPHFVFNCLNSIQNYIYNNDRIQANRYLVKFARLIRMTLDQAEDAFIPLDRELQRLELYLKMEELRFGEKLRYKIINELGSAYSRLQIPNMILQPFVENAIRHGIMPKKEGGSVLIHCSLSSDSQLEILIEDDGTGIHEEKGHNSLHKSMGMTLTRERLKLMEELEQQEFRIEITDRSEEGEGSGTRVRLVLPLVHEPVELALV